MNKMIAVAAFAGLFPLAVLAQKAVGPGARPADDAATPSTAVADGPLVDSLAPPTCKKPVLIANLRSTGADPEFNDKFDAYQTCVKVYVDNQNKVANMHVNMANKAIEDANAFVKETNAKLK